ncbi:MAG TPA: acyltransferase [Gammaproteobacteria bacterium]|nr:acyltransferase [Gammaproteobacteria bacterium]
MIDPELSRCIDRLRREPHLLLPAVAAWFSGWWNRIKLALLGRRFRAGRGLRVYGPLYISGPGRVEFGDDCLIIGNAIKPVCIRTLNANAVVRLGNHAGLNGAAIQCAQSVEIGDWSNIADAYITDTPAHSLSRRRREFGGDGVAAASVRIGRNVWISVQVVVLHGVSIGENSVIGACSLVRQDVPANVFCAGNPLAVISEISD